MIVDARHRVKLQELGVTSSYSRPRVSNDNPYVESLFKTVKYCPQWPSGGFASLESARVWMLEFTGFYNDEHRKPKAKSTGKPDQRRRDNKTTPGNTPELKPSKSTKK
jgi:putative transposase